MPDSARKIKNMIFNLNYNNNYNNYIWKSYLITGDFEIKNLELLFERIDINKIK